MNLDIDDGLNRPHAPENPLSNGVANKLNRKGLSCPLGFKQDIVAHNHTSLPILVITIMDINRVFNWALLLPRKAKPCLLAMGGTGFCLVVNFLFKLRISLL